jgi:choline dehydrogenase-like flavoprotein
MQHPVWGAPRLLLFDKDSRKRVRRSDGSGVSIATAIRPQSARELLLLNFHFLAIRRSAPRGYAKGKRFLRDLIYSVVGPSQEIMAQQALVELESEFAKGVPQEPYEMWLQIRPEQAPNRDSRITLGDRRDAVGMRQAVMDWRLGDLDRHSLQKGLRMLARSMALENVGRVCARDVDLAIDEPQGAFLHGGNHHYGTARMSDSPSLGVVDRNARVHSLQNLYIAGSAVFPTTGYANPTLTIVAMAARLAAHLAKY